MKTDRKVTFSWQLPCCTGFPTPPTGQRLSSRHISATSTTSGRTGRRKEVTGVVVNDKPGVDRKTLRRFRALLYQIETHGPQGKKWGYTPNLLAAIEGYANYVYMVDPEKGEPLKARVREVANSLARAPRKTYPPRKKASVAEKPTAPAPGMEDSAPARPWWKFW